MSDIRNAEELAVVLSEKLDDDAPLNLHSRWRPLAAELWARMGPPDREEVKRLTAALNGLLPATDLTEEN